MVPDQNRHYGHQNWKNNENKSKVGTKVVDYCSPADKMLCPKSIRRQTRPSTMACLSVSSPKYSNSAMCCWLVGKTMNFPLPSVSSLVVLLVDFLTVDREKRIFVVPAGAECNIIFSRLRLGSIHFPFINLCLGILNNILFHLIYYYVMFFSNISCRQKNFNALHHLQHSN